MRSTQIYWCADERYEARELLNLLVANWRLWRLSGVSRMLDYLIEL